MARRVAGGPPRRFTMGLTIHYRLSHPASSAGEAAVALQKLRQVALDLPFEEVGEIRRFAREECDPEKWRETDWFWPLIQAQRWLYLGNDGYGNWAISVPVIPLEAVVFEAWPGEGSESAVFGLAKYPAVVDLSPKTRDLLWRKTGRVYPRRVSTAGLGRGGWSWLAFCKTQYASNVSAAHFLRCHVSICALLREAQKLGFRVKVHDEGRFWGKWDYDALAREIGGWNQHMANFARFLERALGGSEAVVQTPIIENPAYEVAGFDPGIARELAELAQRRI